MTEQISRLADLRVRARRGAYDDDGYGTILGSRQADRRHGFARSLVETGRRSDERERLRDRRKGWRIPGTAHHVARLGHATSTPGPTTGGRT